jgi:hypothetical protein
MIDKNKVLKERIDLIRSFGSLPNSWDGYKAKPISKEVQDTAIQLLKKTPCPIFYIFPTCDESIQFEYEFDDLDIEVEIKKGNNHIDIIYSNSDGEKNEAYTDVSLQDTIRILKSFKKLL